MTEQSDLAALRQQHAKLEATIREEEGRPMPDATVLHDLKRQKLALKDQIAQLEHV